MLKGIRLLDGRLLVGEDWAAVEAAWSNESMNSIIEPGKFRAEIQHRAQVWSGTEILIDGSAEDFLNECERAGMVTTIYNADNVTAQREVPKPAARVVFLNEVREAAMRRLERRAQAQTEGSN
jgi:hypothetical protein